MENKFFAIGHGIENYEVWVDLESIMAVKISSVVTEKLPKEKWTHLVTFIMSNGTELQEDLTDEGMADLADMYRIKGWS